MALSTTEKWNVIINCDEAAKRRFYVLSPRTPVRDILTRFRKDVGLSTNDGGFVDDTGSSMADDRQLGNVDEVAADQHVVMLTYKERQESWVEEVGETEWEKNPQSSVDSPKQEIPVNEEEEMKEDQSPDIEELKQSEQSVSPFFIVNNCSDFNNGSSFAVDLQLPSQPSVGDVRTAIALHMGRSPSSTILKRWVATSGGDPVFQVGNYVFVFADVDGDTREWLSVENWEDKLLTCDEDPFPMVARCRNCLHVHPGSVEMKESPVVPLQLNHDVGQATDFSS